VIVTTASPLKFWFFEKGHILRKIDLDPMQAIDLTLPQHPAGEYTAGTYRDELRKVDWLLGAAISISDSSGGIQTTARFIHATQLYTRLVAGLYSFVRLLPYNRITYDREPFWDWGSVAGIARAVVETYHTFYYVGVENVGAEEVKARLDLMLFHLNSEKYRLYREGNADEKVLKGFQEGLPKDKERLTKNPWFQRLPPKQQAYLLKGRCAMYLPHAEIARRSNVLGAHFRFFYRLFSNQLHATPFAAYSQSNVRGRGIENDTERFYVTSAMQVVIRYVCRAVLDMAEIFPDRLKAKHPTVLQGVRELLEDSLDTGNGSVTPSVQPDAIPPP
jgi:hypothetical protein